MTLGEILKQVADGDIGLSIIKDYDVDVQVHDKPARMVDDVIIRHENKTIYLIVE